MSPLPLPSKTATPPSSPPPNPSAVGPASPGRPTRPTPAATTPTVGRPLRSPRTQTGRTSFVGDQSLPPLTRLLKRRIGGGPSRSRSTRLRRGPFRTRRSTTTWIILPLLRSTTALVARQRKRPRPHACPVKAARQTRPPTTAEPHLPPAPLRASSPGPPTALQSFVTDELHPRRLHPSRSATEGLCGETRTRRCQERLRRWGRWQRITLPVCPGGRGGGARVWRRSMDAGDQQQVRVRWEWGQGMHNSDEARNRPLGLVVEAGTEGRGREVWLVRSR